MSDGGKGDARRPESAKGAYESGYDRIFGKAAKEHVDEYHRALLAGERGFEPICKTIAGALAAGAAACIVDEGWPDNLPAFKAAGRTG